MRSKLEYTTERSFFLISTESPIINTTNLPGFFSRLSRTHTKHSAFKSWRQAKDNAGGFALSSGSVSVRTMVQNTLRE